MIMEHVAIKKTDIPDYDPTSRGGLRLSTE